MGSDISHGTDKGRKKSEGYKACVIDFMLYISDCVVWLFSDSDNAYIETIGVTAKQKTEGIMKKFLRENLKTILISSATSVLYVLIYTLLQTR